MEAKPSDEFIKEKREMRECCYDNISRPKVIGRLHYACPKCGTDITLAVLIYEAAVNE